MTNKVKWLAAVSVLAVGIPMASMAFAAPGEYQYQDKLITPIEQQNIATNVDTANADPTEQETQQTTPQFDQTADTSDDAKQPTSSTTVPGNHPGHTGVNDGYHNNGTSTAQPNQTDVNVTNSGNHNHTGMNDGYHGNTGKEHNNHNSGGHH